MEQINNNSVENKNNALAKKKIGIFLGAVAIIGIIYGIYWFTVENILLKQKMPMLTVTKLLLHLKYLEL